MSNEEPENESWAEIVPPSPEFDPEFRALMVDNFGHDGAWLLFSIIDYGWRAFFDLACALASGPIPKDEEASSVGSNFAVVRHLQIQGHLYAAVEQLATLIAAARAYVLPSVEGEKPHDFFTTYNKNLKLPVSVKAMLELDSESLGSLLGVPLLEDFLTRASKDWQGDGNGPPPATVSIGSADVPRSLLDEGMIEMMRYQTLGMVSEMLVNLQEFQMLVDPPAPVEGVDKNPQALREVDNSFRHGLRVFFNSAAPSERRFHFLGVPSAPSSAASVYLPKGTDTIGFADVDMSDVSTQKLLHGLRLACVRIGEFATAFAGNVCFGTPAYLVAAAGIRLEPTSPPITSIE